jgi:hypothetical protein
MEKVAQNFELLLYVICIELPQINNRPIRANSPNLVTLLASPRQDCQMVQVFLNQKYQFGKTL